MRYRNTRVTKTSDGTQYYVTTKYPEVPLSDTDIWVITNAGDRLDLLAQQYYGDSSLYWIISIANTWLPQDSLFMPNGSQIRIPQNYANVVAQYETLNAL